MRGWLMTSVALATMGSAAMAAPAPTAWQNRALTADQRADLLVQAMTEDEKITVVTGLFGSQFALPAYRRAEARPQSAGYVPGIPRLGFTPQWQSDAGSGVATQGAAPPALERTALPSGILTASTWDPAAATAAGAVVGAEARASGFNEQLAGGVDLDRDPGNGRNFEYGGEDPWLAGTMVGAFIKGIQSNAIITTIKHYAMNDQETGRNFVDVKVDQAAARTSDLLAFQIAIEQGNPWSVMCSYNLVNGQHACQNDWLLNKVLKGDWGYQGFVMSDWGAQHDTVADALGGLDQETGVGLGKTDYHVWLEKLKAAIADGRVPKAVLDDKVRRIARALIASGAVDSPVAPGPIDFAAHALASQHAAEAGIVLLKNQGDILPLAGRAKTIAVFGGHADVGVLSGGGSAQVYSPGGTAVPDPDAAQGFPHPIVYYKSSPVDGLKAGLPDAAIHYSDGADRAAAAAAAKKADVAIVFVTQWTAESRDFPLTLPDDQDSLVAAVAAANPNTIVVLETGAAVTMPWAGKVKGIVEAWYPGTNGGQAIARVLTGAVNPSGHLPISFPQKPEDYPRAKPAGLGLPEGQGFPVTLTEGASVGYKWLGKNNTAPLFAFGHGLSYTSFAKTGLTANVAGQDLRVSFRIRNTGRVAGAEVGQIYVAPVPGGWEGPKRLGGYGKAMLAAGAEQTVTLTIDPRLLATWDEGRHGWHVTAGQYRVTLASSAVDAGSSVTVTLPERWLPAGRGAALASR
ncbi:beta-glucosidase family protein [Sphingomonas nostoxanthinifaciens]|uniref:beta-glucosidase family protein n=1 Tax=Sphingomonas nostoxanthinifaciens TaxID=2872652 RepID=UPI001CC1D3BC|nr:glycoside hydrolase family 3 C-terminal domain-containing protein [Sphingomonas nostoxanthinifaciens]UAK24033.1 glycoside hydrolase family 3 C-terminal domain-containing protein [Sphingomonas nostoxanthinifaciens]